MNRFQRHQIVRAKSKRKMKSVGKWNKISVSNFAGEKSVLTFFKMKRKIYYRNKQINKAEFQVEEEEEKKKN